MTIKTPDLKRIATEVVGPQASSVLMNRIFATVDQTADARTAAVKVEKLVALFLGVELANTLRRGFAAVLESS